MGKRNVTQLGPGRWKGEVQANGTRKRKVYYAETRAEAMRLHRQWCAEVEAMAYPGGSKPPPGVHVMQELADRDILESKGIKKKGSDEWLVKPTNVVWQRNVARYWEYILASPFFAPHMDIREVNGQRIKAYATWRMEQPGSTWNNVHRDVARIGRMLRWAASNDWIPAVPVTKHIYKMAPPGQTACKPHEVADIVRVMDTVSEASRDYHEFVMATGLRHGEMARLTMANITPSVGTPGIAAVIRLTEAKTNSRERGIGLDQWTYDIAKKYAPEDPSKPIWGTTRYRGFARHAKRLLGRTITPRDLRSWFITRMAERDLTAAMLAAGHKNPRTTARYMKNPEAQTAAACSAVHEHMAHIRKRTPIAGTASQKLHISKEL